MREGDGFVNGSNIVDLLHLIDKFTFNGYPSLHWWRTVAPFSQRMKKRGQTEGEIPVARAGVPKRRKLRAHSSKKVGQVAGEAETRITDMRAGPEVVDDAAQVVGKKKMKKEKKKKVDLRGHNSLGENFKLGPYNVQ